MDNISMLHMSILHIQEAMSHNIRYANKESVR